MISAHSGLSGRWLVAHVVAAALVCGLAAGCGGGSGGFTVVPVSGKVTKDGKGLQGINVVFSPSAEGKKGGQAGPGSTGVTDTEGKFVLTTSEKSGRKGAVVGKHHVRLAAAVERAADDDSVKAGKASVEIPQKYADSSLSFDVPAGGTDKADFDLNK